MNGPGPTVSSGQFTAVPGGEAGRLPPDGPVRPPERLATLDILRGFALLGILLINIIGFKAPWGPPGFGHSGPLADRLVLRAVILLVESKFFTLFSFLFGLGFSIQLLGARAKGTRFAPRFLRRLGALLLFGIAHVVLLWEGDILILYSLTGALLLLFRDASPRALLRWSGILLLIPILIDSAGFAWVEAARSSPRSGEALRSADAEVAEAIGRERAAVLAGQHSDGGYVASIVRRLRAYRVTFVLLLTRVPTVLAMFLIGLYAGRIGVLRDVDGHLPLLRRIRAWCLGLGLAISLLVTIGYFGLPPVPALVILLFNQALAGPVLALGYGAALTLLVRDAAWAARLRPLALAGRMSLTNYLSQSLACALIFDGLGLAGRVSPTAALPMAVGIFATQAAASTWWLGRFRYGPAEWLWRSLTYGKLEVGPPERP
jgi:uncharacterized protein